MRLTALPPGHNLPFWRRWRRIKSLWDGLRRALPEMFFVIATQNPVESQGTYPLPEAQMDRFALMFNLGYVSIEEEMSILSDQTFTHPLEGLKACASMGEILELRKAVRHVKVSEEIRRYIVELVAATRSVKGVALGASPRASLTLMKSAQALALINGLDFVSPEEVRELAGDILAHRLSLDPQARFAGLTGRQVVTEVIESLKVPV